MVGSLPEGFILGKLPPKVQTLEEAQELAIYEVNSNASKALAKGVEIDINGYMQCFPCTNLMLLLPAKTQYLETLNSYEEFTAEQLKTTILPAIKNHYHTTKLWQYTTIKSINTAKTIPQLKNIKTTI